MIDNQLLNVLRCPQDQSQLAPADEQLLSQLNQAIQDKQLKNLGGQPIEKHLDGGLIRAAGDLMYPVFDQIPVMLPDEAIDLTPYQ